MGLGRHAWLLLYLVVEGNLPRSISRSSSENMSTEPSREVPALSTRRPPMLPRAFARRDGDLRGSRRVRDILGVAAVKIGGQAGHVGPGESERDEDPRPAVAADRRSVA